MIRSLRLGKIWDVESIIEIINNDKIFLERTQSTPYYHNEELSFRFDGSLNEIRIIKDLTRDIPEYPRSKFGLQIYRNLGVIKSTCGEKSESALKHEIEEVYNLTVPEFYKSLKGLRASKEQQPLKNEMMKLLDIIKNYPFSQYFFFEVK